MWNECSDLRQSTIRFLFLFEGERAMRDFSIFFQISHLSSYGAVSVVTRA
jgi:hypothetical protein